MESLPVLGAWFESPVFEAMSCDVMICEEEPGDVTSSESDASNTERERSASWNETKGILEGIKGHLGRNQGES
jgi:hypothetical protein